MEIKTLVIWSSIVSTWCNDSLIKNCSIQESN